MTDLSQFEASIPITKEYILDRVSEEEIFSRYLGIPIEIHKTFRSPLRSDKNPTCSFAYVNGRLRYRDWAQSGSKDCFDIVQQVTGLTFFEVLDRIAADFGLVDKPPSESVIKKREYIKQHSSSSKSDIKVAIQPFTDIDKRYLSQYGIGPDQVNKFKCFSIFKLFLNNSPFVYYSKVDPMLGYYLGISSDGEQRWKIYFYKRSKDATHRFMGNTNRINGWVQMPDEGPYIVITKSMKDVMTLDALDVPAIAMQNETTVPYDYIIAELTKRFNKIYTLYDFDYTGIVTSNKIKRLYNTVPLFLTNGRFDTKDYGSKDISDYVRDNTFSRAEDLVRYAKEKYAK